MRSPHLTPETLCGSLVHAVAFRKPIDVRHPQLGCASQTRAKTPLSLHSHCLPRPSGPCAAVTSQANGSSRNRNSNMFKTKRAQQVHLAPLPAFMLSLRVRRLAGLHNLDTPRQPQMSKGERSPHPNAILHSLQNNTNAINGSTTGIADDDLERLERCKPVPFARRRVSVTDIKLKW